MDGNLVTAFDAFALGLLFLSGILALTRGFIREALSVTAFVLAAMATIFTYPVLKTPMRALITPGWAADAATITGIFILVYMAVTLVTHHFNERLRGGSDVGALDRSAGFVFGIVRGMALLGLALILFNQLTPVERMPNWLTKARMYPAINATARAMQDMAPASAPVNDRAVIAATKPDSTSSAKPKGANQGYARGERQSLDQLISTSTENSGDEPNPGKRN